MKQLIAYLQSPRRLALFVVLASAGILAVAYVSQYGFGLKPCILCLYQRGPYFVNIALGLLAFAATLKAPRAARPLLYLCVLGFLCVTAIAGFHVGVEQGWWKGLAECGGDIVPKNATVEELRRALEHQNIVHCDKPAFVLFGVSMAGYNFIASLCLALFAFHALRSKHAA